MKRVPAGKTFPVSMGMNDGKHETKNGTYYVLEKFPDIVMDSSTYGVPVNSPNGYKIKVQWAVRIDNSGGFVHSAPWSVADQGKRNVAVWQILRDNVRVSDLVVGDMEARLVEARLEP